MPRLLTPNANYIPASARDIFTDRERSALHWDIGQLTHIAQASGYDGIELHDSRLFKHNRQLRRATSQQASVLGRLIFSFHESWVDVSDPQPIDPAQARIQATGSWAAQTKAALQRAGHRAVFRPGPDSLDHLGAIEQKLGRPDPMQYAMYPNVRGLRTVDQAKTARHPNSNIQPTIDVAAAWGTETPEEFIEEMRIRRYGGIWPSFHGDRKGKVVDGRMSHEEYLPAMLEAGLVRAVHVEVFRNDFTRFDPGRTELSIQEGRALQNDGKLAGTPLDSTFSMLRDANWAGDVTIESPLGGMESALGKLSIPNVIDLHSEMTASVRAQLPHINWDTPPQAA